LLITRRARLPMVAATLPQVLVPHVLRRAAPLSVASDLRHRLTIAPPTARPARASCVRCQRPAWTVAEDGAALCRTCATV
jgi:hypothetical protein